MATPQNRTVEKRLGLPGKTEERELFNRFDLFELLERYSPLADFYLDDYAYPNDNANIVIKEMVHNALMHSLIRYRNKNRHMEASTFTFFFTLLVNDIMADYAKEGLAYKVSISKIMGK